MIRKRENSFAIRAGALSVLVHGLLLMLLLFSFHWKTVQPMSVAQVELWEAIPAEKAVQPPKPEPTPEPPKPEPKPELKPEPKPDPAPEPQPKAEIQVKKEPVKPKEEKPVKPKEEPKPEPKKKDEKPKEDMLKKLQQAMLEEDAKATQAAAPKTGPAASASPKVDPSEVAKYIGLITNKIRRNVNSQLCGSGKPELTFNLNLMPTGELIGAPRLVKGSGIPACDDAVERAILQSQPLPLPTQPDLLAQFRNLELKFRPNE